MTKNVKFCFDDIEFNGLCYVVSGVAVVDYTLVKGRMYMSNGDPGYPDESSVEVEDIIMDELVAYDENGVDFEVEDDKIIEYIEEIIADRVMEMDFDD